MSNKPITDTKRLDFAIKHDVSFGQRMIFYTGKNHNRTLKTHEGNNRHALDDLIKSGTVVGVKK